MYAAYKIDKDISTIDSKGNVRYRTDFILDTEEDIPTFKTQCKEYPPGTTGYVASTGEALMLNCQGEYV